ncbi:hypothetical protein EYC84_011640 [Monilinia fructicola]|uniref:Uncharacterized protein n=1 Tax=Monilinia fructicola TaxID=38448 RepID=A0A5M9J8W5_MONFR|nr:hypothetical protein EYC84_011640 [Monilinia fructicola]
MQVAIQEIPSSYQNGALSDHFEYVDGSAKLNTAPNFTSDIMRNEVDWKDIPELNALLKISITRVINRASTLEIIEEEPRRSKTYPGKMRTRLISRQRQ